MLIQKAFQYELRPDGATRRAFSRFAGPKRFVWNAALKQSKYLGYANNCAILPRWKIEKPWLMEIHSQVLQQGLKDLDKAFKNFFEKRAERPAPKKKGKCSDSFRFPQGFKIEEGHNRIYLPKIVASAACAASVASGQPRCTHGRRRVGTRICMGSRRAAEPLASAAPRMWNL